MKKIITKDCPSCNDLIINDEGEFECKWGKSKKRKILRNSDKKISLICNLKKRIDLK